jgi:exosortase/archaeosortase family protein
MSNTFFEKFDKSLLWAGALVLGCLGVVIWDQEIQWRTREDYAFGYLVPVFFGYVLFERWPQIRAVLLGEEPAPETIPGPSPKIYDVLVFAGLLLSLFSFAIGAVMRAVNGTNILATYFNTFGFLGIFAGGLWLFSAKNALGRTLGFRERVSFLRLFTFPVLVWLISGPMLYIMDTSVRTFLLVRVTLIVVDLLNSVGMDLHANQGIITLPRILPTGLHDIVGVTDACSGVRSLTACIFMGAFLSAIFVKGAVRKVVLLGMALVFAVVLNLMRTSFLTMWAYKNGSKALEYDLWGNPVTLANGDANPAFTLGTVHDVVGYTAMTLTFLLLLAVLPVVNLRLRRSDQEMRGRGKRGQKGKGTETGNSQAIEVDGNRD